MPQPNLQHARSGLLSLVFAAALVSHGLPLSGQQQPTQPLPLQREYPGPGPYECPILPRPMEPTPDERERAAQLTSDALQAVILGDLEGARDLLSQATAADATSSEFAYRHARVLEDLGLPDAAISEYCRALSLGSGDPSISDARDRLDALYEIVRERISDRALAAFVSGLRQADAVLYEDAVESFGVAIEEDPGWAAAVYNRALVLEQLGRIQESLEDYHRYLELTPNEIDPVVVGVSERIGMLEGDLARPTPSPGNALALGVLFPGMGQYYSGRGLAGTLVLSAAASVVVMGLMYRDVTVRCLTAVEPGQDCPPGQIVDQETRHPYLVPALGATAAVMVGAAVEAFIRARRARAERSGTAGEPVGSGIRVVAPSVTTTENGLDVNFLRLRFR